MIIPYTRHGQIVSIQRLALFLILFCPLLSCAHTSSIENESKNEFNPLLSIVQFYQGPLNHLSAVKKGDCPMYPSCSNYSVKCFEKHGLFIGWMMSCDRLMRCGFDELTLSPRVIVDRESKCYDSVQNNDFW